MDEGVFSAIVRTDEPKSLLFGIRGFAGVPKEEPGLYPLQQQLVFPSAPPDDI
jgi:hypothetical protein